VSAQIIELSRKTGPTHFLTLRDERDEVSVSVTISTAVLDAAGPVGEGMTVTAQLKPTVWLKSGRLSYECFDLRPTGEGRLLAQIEHLKRLLQAEGLFNPALKRPLPVLPRQIGLITAQQSAAERDVTVNVRLRWPGARIETHYALMQGPSCAGQVMAALAELDADPGIDVIVIARGGGSIEDLLPFSDEGLVRAVAQAHTPVVSAIGHEVDTPILDLVADLRASTPTDAAKRIVPDAAEELAGVGRTRARLMMAVNSWLNAEATGLRQVRGRPVLHDPLSRFDVYTTQIESARHRLVAAAQTGLDQQRALVGQARALVGSLSPQAVLTRGYALLVDETGRTVTAAAQAKLGADLTAQLSDGSLTLRVLDQHLPPRRRSRSTKETHGNN
jgi:exodeoxyribonuclease VII large subunit